jgi:predicted amino acid racemase
LSAPRLEIDLERLHHNACILVDRLAARGIALTAVSKATLAMPEIVRTWLAAGVASIGDARIENLEALVRQGVSAPLLLIRSPMLSQVERVVAHATISCNSEPLVLQALARSAARQGVRHGVLLMVELGDLREGILATDLEAVAQLTLALPSLELVGIGTNLGCQHGIAPDAANMAVLSGLVGALERRFRLSLPCCSGGNSANLPWLAAGGDPGRVNHLRLGEALLLGREPLGRTAIPGLFTDAITLVAEVIESRSKPSRPWGRRRLSSFAGAFTGDRTSGIRTLLALGEQDIDPAGLIPEAGQRIHGASSDHLVVSSGAAPLRVGEEVRFQLRYSALLRAMTSPYVSRCFVSRAAWPGPGSCRPAAAAVPS